MIFLLVTVISMLISVFLVFKLIKYMGIRLYFKPLLLCALCAVAFNYLLPWVAIYAANYQFPILLSTTLAAAYAITVYQQRLASKDDLTDTETAFAAEAALTAAQLTEPSAKVPFAMAVPSEPVENNSHLIEKTAIADVPIAAVGFHLPQSLQPSSMAIAAGNIGTAITATAPAELPAAIEQPVPKPKLYLIKTPNPAKAETAVKKAAAQAPQTDLPVEEPTTDRQPVRPGFPILDNAEKIRLNRLTDLDALLDNGFTALNAHNYASAVFAYKRALLLFSSDDYAPFIVIELGNIFKTTGYYDKAIAIYQQAFTLPSIAADEVMQKEFTQNIRYLSILQQHLTTAHQENTPFADISSELLQQAETDFQNRRRQNS